MNIATNRSRWLKWTQRRLLSFLATPEGCVVGVLGLVITVNTLLYVALGPCAFTAVLDILKVNKWATPSSRSLCNQVGWKDNIGGVDVSHRTSFGPIDVVYTWVNGSDERWLRKKAYWKAVESNISPPVGSSPDGSMKRMVRGTRRRRLSEHDDNIDDRGSSFGYDGEYGGESGYIDEYGHSTGYDSGYGSAYGSRYDSGYGSGYGSRYSGGRYGDDYHSYDRDLYDDVHEEPPSVNDTIINATDRGNVTAVNSTSINNTSINNTIAHGRDEVPPKEEEKEEEKDDADADNRYRDSNELLYSLRSLEKYAPWVRHIYIVTDNQVSTLLPLSYLPHLSQLVSFCLSDSQLAGDGQPPPHSGATH